MLNQHQKKTDRVISPVCTLDGHTDILLLLLHLVEHTEEGHRVVVERDDKLVF